MGHGYDLTFGPASILLAIVIVLIISVIIIVVICKLCSFEMNHSDGSIRLENVLLFAAIPITLLIIALIAAIIWTFYSSCEVHLP